MDKQVNGSQTVTVSPSRTQETARQGRIYLERTAAGAVFDSGRESAAHAFEAWLRRFDVAQLFLKNAF
jgi:hypothetical protein